jgi:hypothetical protein
MPNKTADPVLVLFTEWKRRWWAEHRIKDDGRGAEGRADRAQGRAMDRLLAVGEIVARTPATSFDGVAAKLIMASSHDDPLDDLWRSAAADARRLADLPGRRSGWPPAWVEPPARVARAGSRKRRKGPKHNPPNGR